MFNNITSLFSLQNNIGSYSKNIEAIKDQGRKLYNLVSIFRKQSVPLNEVTINIVDEPLYFGPARSIGEDEIITVVYDRESLDSLYGLAFFTYLYGDRVQAVAYHNAFTTNDDIKQSAETVILGVEVTAEDLIRLNDITKGIRVFAYRGSFDYLYDENVQKNYENVTLFQSDNDYYIGGKNIGQLENTVAMMLKILYFYSYEWSLWKQHRYAMQVAHYTCFYPNIPDYGLTKSILQIEEIKDEKGVSKKKTTIHNNVDALLWDFKFKLEAALDSKTTDLHEVIPVYNLTDHNVYRQRLKTHIERTRRLQGWMEKGVIVGGKDFAYCVPAISFAVQDIIALSCNSVNTTVCVEDIGEQTIYYVYSKTPGKADKIARLIDGENSWMIGNIICVSKMKGKHERR